jgi:hypothetical protein
LKFASIWHFFFGYGLKTPVAAASRVLDTMMLQKIRQQRQSDFRGLDLAAEAPTPKQLLNDEKVLIRKHGNDLATRMQNNGFTGLSVEARARQLGLSELYNIVYRNFSKHPQYRLHGAPGATNK